MKTHYHVITFALLANMIIGCVGCSCNGLPPTVSSVPVTVIKHGQKIDTIKKDASLGVFCPPKMKLNETRIITVWIKVNKTKAQIRDYVIETEKESNDWVSQDDSTSVIPISLQLYDSVKVSIKYDTADFKITPAIGNDQKYTKVDIANGNLWQWNITAVSKDKRSSKITLIVEPHTPPDFDLVPIPSHEIPIIIYFDFGDMIRGWIRYLGEHPGYTVPVVLVPLITTIFAIRKYRRWKKKKNKG